MLNPLFVERMKKLLFEEADDFISTLLSEDEVKGIRVNTLKSTTEGFLKKTELSTEELPYCPEGFILNSPIGIGSTPEHHAGMIYVQDPGAMSTLCALDIKEGWWVLDSCSAPGGKSTQAVAKIGDGGFILSNEYEPKRAKTLVSNFERLGVRCGVITSLDTKEIGKMYQGTFDLVIADVPCSGEGMFRKSEDALTMWSPENVELCAKRQRQILNNLRDTVKPNGYLIYSTCTYSLSENEMVVDDFLYSNPDYEIVEVKEELKKVTRDGICFEGAKSDKLHYARRFYPHVSRGEGQFVALLKRRADADVTLSINYKDGTRVPTREESEAIAKFVKESLTKTPDGRIAKYGDNLVLITHSCPIPQRAVFSAGVLLGEVKKGLLFPSHQFFSAYGKLFKRQESLSKGDPRVEKYLRGEEIYTEISDNGWCAVTYEGATLGGGKISGGVVKNHYPKGLRKKG